MSQTELDEKLKLIAEAMKKANGDTKKEARYLANIIDPADETACEGCQ